MPLIHKEIYMPFFMLAISSQFYYMLIFCQKRSKIWKMPLIILSIYMTNFIARCFEANFLKTCFWFFWPKRGQKSTWLESVTALYERHFWLKVLKIVLNSESSEMWIFPPVLSWLKSKQTLSVYISPEEWK